MGIGHCLNVREIRIYQIRYAADKTLVQRLFHLTCTPYKGFGKVMQK